MKFGDFTALSHDYSHRPAYAKSVLPMIFSLLEKPAMDMDLVDVGAGTGIWTRMLHSFPVQSIVAIEPNAAMRLAGETHAQNGQIAWQSGSGEATGLANASVDFLSMASSFHWVNFEKGVAEFNRVLRPGGVFVALWNTRYLQDNPLLLEIEEYLTTLKGGKIARISSGQSEFTQSLTKRLELCGYFREVIYLETKHEELFSKKRYLGVWKSVNDLQVQLGAEKFAGFMEWLDAKLAEDQKIQAKYLNRVWVARKPKL